MKIAFLGIGRMGSVMVPHLIENGFEVTVWNRTRSKADALMGLGVSVAETPEDCVASADVMITILSDGPTVDAVMFGIPAEAFKPGCVAIDMTSIAPAQARQHALQWKERGVRYLDAPVSGGTKGAQGGSLAIMVGGDQDTFIECLPVLTSLGRPTLVGPVGAGQVAKLCNQVIVATTIGAVAEAIHLAQSAGVNPLALRDALTGGFADSRILQEHGLRMIEQDFIAGGVVRNQIKDLVTALDAADELEIHLPLASLTKDLFTQLEKSEGGEIDHSALILLLQKDTARA